MADYTITSVRQTSEITPAGQLQDVVEATYELAGGLGSGQVRVPKVAGWPEKLQEAVAADAAGVASLFG